MTQNKRTLTAADLLELKSVQGAHISADGALIAYEVSDRYQLDTKSPRSAIWIVSARGGDARQLTTGTRCDNMPRWSPDSQWLAFLSDRIVDGQPQIYLMSRHGGEALPLTTVKGDIWDLQWSADGRRIYFLKVDPQTDDEKKREEAKDDAIEFEGHPQYARVHVVDVATKEVSQLTHGNWHAWEFDVSADGARLAFVAADNPFEWSWYQSQIAIAAPLLPAASSRSGGGDGVGAGVRTLHQTKRQLARPLISPGGQWMAFLTSTWSDRGVTAGDLYIVSTTGGGEAKNLTPNYGGSVSWMEWSADARTLIFLALENLDSAFCEVDIATGHIKKLWSGAVGIANPFQPMFSLSADRQTLAVVRESATEPRDVWLARRVGESGSQRALASDHALEWKRLTDMYPHIGEFEPLAMESIRWKGADGWEMQGFLLKPHGYEAGKRYPMVTVVHGGPTSAYTHAFPLTNRWIGLLAAHGMVVLMPNPRGSTGWGLKFAEANLGDMGGKDFQDIMRGVDTCIALGIADEKRLGIAGWSYGGFMTMWAVSQTARFKAAMAGAGIANWKSFHGLTKYPTWDALFYGADPYDVDKEAAYELFSPLTYIKRIQTPTLIVHGERDPDVPAAQAYEFHRALKDHGVETQLVIYPREKHGFTEKAHLLDLWNRIAHWFAERL